MPQKGTAGSSPVHPATFKARKVKFAGFFVPTVLKNRDL